MQHIDFAKAASLGVSVASINDTLSTAWGSSYVNDFYDRGRIKQVYVQGDEKFRQRPKTWIAGMYATIKAKWFRSQHFAPQSGNSAPLVWNVSTA